MSSNKSAGTGGNAFIDSEISPRTKKTKHFHMQNEASSLRSCTTRRFCYTLDASNGSRRRQTHRKLTPAFVVLFSKTDQVSGHCLVSWLYEIDDTKRYVSTLQRSGKNIVRYGKMVA